MDNMSVTQRSHTMSRIRNRDNKSTELKLLRILKNNNIVGWRRQFLILGRPDFAFPKKKVAIFVDGCFWHGCRRCYSEPKSNVTYWKSKIANNIERDRRVTKELKQKGWRVVRIKEHTLNNNPGYIKRRLIKILTE